MYWIIPFLPHVNSFLDFSLAKLSRHKELLSKIETESTKSAKCDLCLSANGMVYGIRVFATVHNIAGLFN